VAGLNLHRTVTGPEVPDVAELQQYRLRRGQEEVTSSIGMVIFLASWAMMFAALFFAYAVVRSRAPVWPPPDQPRLPILLPGVNTVIIAASSGLISVAVRATALGRLRHAFDCLGIAAILGAIFLMLQVVVWASLWNAGLVPDSGPYASVFYALTTFHALHVLVGLVALVGLTLRARQRRATRTKVRLWGMFWHFVGAVWLAVYLAVYVA
jgi:cytochrome c oxidase subunit 3